jgi:hypothetical protein
MARSREALRVVRSALIFDRSRSLNDIFQPDDLEKLGSFSPHADYEEGTQQTVDWMNELGFVTGRNKNQIRAWASMNWFAHDGERSAVELSGRVYAVLFVMDDWLSNDAQDIYLNAEQKRYLGIILKSFLGRLHYILAGQDARQLSYQVPPMSEFPKIPDGASDEAVAMYEIEQSRMIAFFTKIQTLFGAAWQVLVDLAHHTNQQYMQSFANELIQHVSEGLKPQDNQFVEMPDLGNYIELRKKVSGMRVGRKLIELTAEAHQGLHLLRQRREVFRGKNEFLPANATLLARLEQMEAALEDYGGLGNDVFSVAKEVFRDGTIFNFLAVSILWLAKDQHNSRKKEALPRLNKGAMTLAQEKLYSLTTIFTESYLGDGNQVPSLDQLIDQLTSDDLSSESAGISDTCLDQIKESLKAYGRGLVQYFQATYYWELAPAGGLDRYKHAQAPFTELTPDFV